jgi:hypothetical protein
MRQHQCPLAAVLLLAALSFGCLSPLTAAHGDGDAGAAAAATAAAAGRHRRGLTPPLILSVCHWLLMVNAHRSSLLLMGSTRIQAVSCNPRAPSQPRTPTACGHHHPDVLSAHTRLLGLRLAVLELQEGPAAAAAATAAAAEWAGPLAPAAQQARRLQTLLTEKAAAAQQAAAVLVAPGNNGVDTRRRLAQSAAPIRIETVFQLGSNVPADVAVRIRSTVIPASVAALRKYVRVKKGGATGLTPRPFDGRQSCLAEIPRDAEEAAAKGVFQRQGGGGWA